MISSADKDFPLQENISRRIVLAQRPEGAPTPEDFRYEEVACAELQDGQISIEVQTFSLDPYMRGRMSPRKSYAAATNVGDVMPAEGVGIVAESRSELFAPGQLVLAATGWQSRAIVDAKAARLVSIGELHQSAALGILGMPGFTAYAGLKKLGRVSSGETLVVAAATGPVGSAVGQLAKLAGARVVGIAGGPEKCGLLMQEFGFDVALDHKSEDFANDLARACPDGIDVYFENVGGKVFEAVLPLLNTYARIPVCGVISQYNEPLAEESAYSTQGLLRLILNKSLEIRGFINDEFRSELWDEFQKQMQANVAAGQVRFLEDFVDGIENAPKAFMGMLEGKNLGKLLIRV